MRSIEDRTKKKEYESTFFPDDAEVDEVLDAITTVYALKFSTVQHPPKLKGMKLRKTGGTVYPDSEDKYSE